MGMYPLTQSRGKDGEVFEKAKCKETGVGRDAQRIGYQSLESSLLQTITHPEDVWDPWEI